MKHKISAASLLPKVKKGARIYLKRSEISILGNILLAEAEPDFNHASLYNKFARRLGWELMDIPWGYYMARDSVPFLSIEEFDKKRRKA